MIYFFFLIVMKIFWNLLLYEILDSILSRIFNFSSLLYFYMEDIALGIVYEILDSILSRIFNIFRYYIIIWKIRDCKENIGSEERVSRNFVTNFPRGGGRREFGSPTSRESMTETVVAMGEIHGGRCSYAERTAFHGEEFQLT